MAKEIGNHLKAVLKFCDSKMKKVIVKRTAVTRETFRWKGCEMRGENTLDECESNWGCLY